MNWQDKLKYLVESVLNVYSDKDYRYRLTIVDNHTILITHPMEAELKSWHRHDLSAHWKEAASIVIKNIINRRMETYLISNA